ncbi:MAG: LuxR C-terminal-related transcriptional regulator [Acidimicrobiales bacterium]
MDLGDLLLELLAALAVTSRIDVGRRLALEQEVADAVAAADLDASPAGRALVSHLAYDRALACAPAAEVRATARRAVLHPALEDQELVASGAFYQGLLALHFADDAAGVELGVRRGLLAAERLGNEPLFGAMHNLRGAARVAEGRIAEALDDLATSVQVVRRTGGLTLPGTFANLALATALHGDLPGALAALDLPAGGERWEAGASYTHYLFARGWVRLQAGDDRGAADLRTVIDRQQALGADNPATIPAAFALAEHLAPASPAEAADLWRPAAALAERFGAPRTLACARRVGALVEPTRALEHLERAVAVVDGTPWGLESLRCRLALGAALAQVGRSEAAREVLRRVLADADELGARSLADRAQALLVASGARPRRRALTGPGSLTPTERHVAALAADGLTNREIAARRFVSVKAVEFQLANAYRKLGIRSRAELPGALAD